MLGLGRQGEVEVGELKLAERLTCSWENPCHQTFGKFKGSFLLGAL